MTELTDIEAKEIALSLMIRSEIAGMAADGELLTIIRPVIHELLMECGLIGGGERDGKPH